jgi:hypothetical protein
MKKNVGNIDRGVRIALAVVLSVLFFTGTVSGIAGQIMLVAGGVLLATALVSFCPLYALVGLNTCPAKKD